MTKNLLLLFVTIFCYASSLFAQGLPCGTPHGDIAKALEQEADLRHSGQAGKFRALTYIPVKAHLVRTSAGVTGLTTTELIDAFAQLNEYFKNSQIQFYLCGTSIHYIDSDTYYDFNSTQEAALCAANDVNDAINLYCTNSVTSGGKVVGGYAYFPGSGANTNRIFMRNVQVNDDKTLAHEFGHFFYLFHTFQDNDNANAELVTRGAGANCTTKGDLLCSTSADPYNLTNATFSGCTYTGTTLDLNGVAYAPGPETVNNIMSYYFCQNLFTTEQYARMQNSGLPLRTAAGNAYSYTCAASGLSDICPTVAVASSAGSVGSTAVNVSWTSPGGGSTQGYIILRSTNAGAFSFIAGVEYGTTIYTDRDVASNTTYAYKIIPANKYSSSCATSITTGLIYCGSSYSTACTNNVAINSFGFNASTNIANIGSGCSTQNLGDYTNLVANVGPGNTYNFSLSAVLNAGSFYPQHMAIWIDANKDGTFSTSERVFQSTGTVMSGTNIILGSLVIPSGASTGLTRMRVRTRHSAHGTVDDACTTYASGETEDYALNIIAGLPPTYCTPTYSNSCSGTAVGINAFSLTGVGGSSISNSGSGCSAANYGDFTAQSVNVMAGSTYNCSLTALAPGGVYYVQHLAIWIDVNKDGIFSTAERVFQSTSGTYMPSPTVNETITIPASTVGGAVRMRVRTQYRAHGVVAEPCANYSYGETEDYTLNVTSILPIELVGFKGKLNCDHSANFEWKTASEQNVEAFVVEYSATGLEENWRELSKSLTPSKGTTSREARYNIKLEGMVLDGYYRLRNIDKDHQADVSKPIYLSQKCDEDFKITSLFPNPSSDKVTLEYSSNEENMEVQLYLYDLTGTLIQNTTLQSSEGNNRTEIDLQNLAQGLYFVVLDNGSSKITQRLVKH